MPRRPAAIEEPAEARRSGPLPDPTRLTPPTARPPPPPSSLTSSIRDRMPNRLKTPRRWWSIVRGLRARRTRSPGWWRRRRPCGRPSVAGRSGRWCGLPVWGGRSRPPGAEGAEFGPGLGGAVRGAEGSKASSEVCSRSRASVRRRSRRSAPPNSSSVRARSKSRVPRRAGRGRCGSARRPRRRGQQGPATGAEGKVVGAADGTCPAVVVGVGGPGDTGVAAADGGLDVVRGGEVGRPGGRGRGRTRRGRAAGPRRRRSGRC
jgi:hypothetical protein